MNKSERLSNQVLHVTIDYLMGKVSRLEDRVERLTVRLEELENGWCMGVEQDVPTTFLYETTRDRQKATRDRQKDGANQKAIQGDK